jgi:hypothetical protein
LAPNGAGGNFVGPALAGGAIGPRKEDGQGRDAIGEIGAKDFDRSLKKKIVAASCRITTRNSSRLIWMYPGSDGGRTRQYLTLSDHPTSNQKRMMVEKPPPPSSLASPVVLTLGSRGMMKGIFALQLKVQKLCSRSVMQPFTVGEIVV